MTELPCLIFKCSIILCAAHFEFSLTNCSTLCMKKGQIVFSCNPKMRIYDCQNYSFFQLVALLLFSITLRFITSTLQLPLSHPLPSLSNIDITPIAPHCLLTTKLETFKDINCIIETVDHFNFPSNHHKGSYVMPEVS